MDSITFNNYGQERERIATESEIEIFNIIRDILNRNDLELVRKSNNYVSVVLNDWDVARFKYTTRAKWINIPLVDVGSVKHKITNPDDVRVFENELIMALEHISKFM